MIYMWALVAREVQLFRKLWLDTILSPIVSVGLYLAVFGVVVGQRSVGGTAYLAFVYAGLLAMTTVNSSFSNPAFALVIAKNVGTFIDLQLVPIAPWRVGIGYTIAAAVRGMFTAAVAVAFTAWFVPGFSVANPFLFVAAFILTGLEFGMLGVIFGLRAKNFEALTFMTTFIMQPMIFLAGVFFPIATLPGFWSMVAKFNPLHHNVNLIRAAFTGYSDTSVWLSLAVVAGIAVILFSIMNGIAKKLLQTK